MSKITFRADDDLVERLEAMETSKSEAMREALRTYLDGTDRDDEPPASDSVDDVIRERVDELVGERLDDLVGRARPSPAPDLNVNVTVDGVKTTETDENDVVEVSESESADRKTRAESGVDPGSAREKVCDKCGEEVDADHVYCPNCGEKVSHRVFCECGDELRSDWAFCPSCGRRTSAADVLERT